MENVLNELSELVANSRKELSLIKSGGQGVPSKVVRTRQLLQDLSVGYRNLTTHCGAAENIYSPARWEIMDYLSSLTDSNGEPLKGRGVE